MGKVSVWLGASMLWAVQVSAQPQPVAGSTAGGARVTEGGGAEYRIPIQVPPGIAGMEPKLALIYSNLAGPGLMGVGWNVEGLTAVTRCPRTLAQDGARGGVNYNAEDRFCLDGQRLIVLGGAAYGAAGAEYRTERESFTKVVSYGSAGNGPMWFKAWTKSGQIIEYGNTPDSRVEAQNASSARTWAVNRISDTKGNAITFSYLRTKETGEHYPDRIEYAFNGASANARVEFVYTTRLDNRTYYEAGSAVQVRKLLSSVRTHAGAALVRDYQLAYDNNGVAGRARLLSVKECGGNGTCFAPTTFSMLPQHTRLSPPQAWATSTFDPSADWFTTAIHERVWPVDVNGDGRVDILGIAENYVGVQLSTGSGFGPRVTWATSTFNPSAGWFDKSIHSRVWIADVTGDGLPDIVGLTNGLVAVQVNTGSSFTGPQTWATSTFDPSGGWFDITIHPRVWMVDVNGDGRSDILGITNGYLGVQLSTGTGFLPPQAWATSTLDPQWGWFNNGNHNRVWIADVTGDGLPDVVGLTNSLVSVQVNTGTSFTPPQSWATQTFEPSGGWLDIAIHARLWMTDVNGDGRADILGITNGYLGVQLSTGTGFLPPQAWATATFDPQWGWFDNAIHNRVWITDVTGDGLPDVLGVTNGLVVVQVNTGASFHPPQTWATITFDPAASWFTTSIQNRVWIADATGDGIADIVGLTNGYLGVQISESTSGPSIPDAVATVTNGIGGVASFAYKRMNDATVYTKDAGTFASAYPILDLQFGRPVVATLSMSNGNGGMSATSYAYGGAKADVNGRGMLGFRWLEAVDPAGIKVGSEYRQDWPFTGMPATVKRMQPSGAVLGQVSNSYVCMDPATGGGCSAAAGARAFVFNSQSVESGADLNGAALPTITRTNAGYDLYGNVGTVTVATNDGFSKTTVNQYTPDDPANWLLGRLTRAEVTAAAPGVPSQIRVSSFAYDSASGLLTKEIIEPGSSLLCVVTEYGYDGFGNRESALTRNCNGSAGEAAAPVGSAAFAPRTSTTSFAATTANPVAGQFPTSSTNALGHTEAKVFDARFGVSTRLTGPNGLDTTWTYDDFGRKQTETRADGTGSTWTYSVCGSCPAGGRYAVTVASAGAPTTTSYHDELNRVIRTETQGFDGTLVRKDSEFDALGRVARVSQPHYAGAVPAWTSFTYDLLGRVIAQTEANNAVTTSSYNGLATSVTNALNQTETRTRNSQGQVIRVVRQ